MSNILKPINLGKERFQDDLPPSKRSRKDQSLLGGTAVTVDDILERGPSRLPTEQQDTSGPTSYAGLIPGSVPLRAPAAVAGAAAKADADDASHQQLRRVKTFQDVASTRQHASASGLPLASADWLPPIVVPLATLPTNDDNATQQVVEAMPLPSTVPPIDWCLKSLVRFTSSIPFTIWDDARHAPRSEVIKAQRAFASGRGINGLSLKQALIASAMTWQYPQDPQPLPTSINSGPGTTTTNTNVAAAAAAAKQRKESVRSRQRDWQAAFASVYDALRSGNCDAFYIVFPEAPSGTGKKPFAALFRSAGVGGVSRLHAMLTRSTPGLRKVFEQQNIGFEMPLVGNGSNRAKTSSEHSVDGSRSLLFFEGALRVHGLFEMLLNRAFALQDDACDVPVLIAPVQFDHAAPCSFVLESVGSGMNSNKNINNNGATVIGERNHLILRGNVVLPPWVIDRVLSVLSATKNSDLTATFEVWPESIGLNWIADCSGRNQGEQKKDNLELDDIDAQERGCFGAEEARRWRQGERSLRGAAIKELRCDDAGMYEVKKLTARVLPQVLP